MLQLIVDGKSNREIAEALFIVEGTVKTHIKNIYGKLDVWSRTQAIAQARELKLLKRVILELSAVIFVLKCPANCCSAL